MHPGMPSRFIFCCKSAIFLDARVMRIAAEFKKKEKLTREGKMYFSLLS